MNNPSNLNNPNSADGISEQSTSESQTQELSATESLDPQQTTIETAALAAHLQRAGIIWLPRPDTESIEQIATRFPACDATPVEPAGSDGHQSDPAQVNPAQVNPAQVNPAQANPATAGTKPGSHRPASKTPASKTPAHSSNSTDTRGNNESGSQSAQTRATSNRPAATRPASRLQGVSAIQTAEQEYAGSPQPTDQRNLQLQQLEQAVESCTLCPALASCRTKTVFGEGNPSPRFAFFGEGPGEEEDSIGQPFVGRAGDLLTKMMQACTLQRDEVYILNTVKCRPPGDRNPEGDELSNCRSFYQQQFDLLRPEYIVCLGAVSAQELLGTKLSVGRLRGTLHRYFASKVLVTYHPSYLLRNPAAKKAAWADLQYLMRDAGIEIPPR
ncbi:uracil-DNA glycosylase [Rubripirellula sp.]|nr:uracil-DNA glycosylase [Rubripirellula sp.]